MSIKRIVCLLSFTVTFWACKEDELIKTTVLTSSGNEISMDGIWKSSCLDFTNFRLNENFNFDGENLIITIHQYSAETCENPDATEIVTITFQTLETIDVKLEGKVVTGTQIKGTQVSSKDGKSSTFKQTFYVDDSSGKNILYHGVFEDDGGEVSTDGYPLELHPFAIVQE